ncbi:MAG: hypothetical protein J5I93_28375 [Pirellulaceae bacterium]|nr:hypothetical protein [Pirellulaceae bacterium]
MNATLLANCVLWTTLGLNPPTDVVEDHVDLIEVNHVYDAKGQHVFDQTIYYEWSNVEGRYQVLAWRLLKADAQIPLRDWQRGDYQAVWKDGPVLRRVRAPVVHHSWTQHDPELIEREFLPRDRRRELTTPRQLGELATSP